MKKGIWMLMALGLILSVSSCSKNDQNYSDLYTPTSEDVTANATLDELKNGRDLYIHHCGNCHRLYSPDDFSTSQWNRILSNMAPYTSMTSSEVSLVSKYITRGR